MRVRTKVKEVGKERRQSRRDASRPSGATFDFSPILLAVLAATLLLPSLFYPLARDQGVFAYVGSVILKGGWPYRDVWEVKPPGIYYTYAAILATFCARMSAIRAADLLAACATALLLRAALCRVVRRDAAWLGGLLSAALYLRLGFWGMAQAESYANFWTVAALVIWLWAGEWGPGVQMLRRPGDQTPRRSGAEDAIEAELRPSSPPLRPRFALTLVAPIAAGVAAAAAVLLKVTALPPLAAALGVVSVLRGHRAGWRQEVRRAVHFLIGLLGPLGLTAVLMGHSGAGRAYLEIQRGFVAGYVAMPQGATNAAAAGWRYFWHLYSLPSALALIGLLVASGSARLLLGAWLVAAVASVAMQRKYFGYHWTPVLLPLAALAGIGLAWMLGIAGRRFTTETRRHGDADREGAAARMPVDPTADARPQSRSLSVSPCLRGEIRRGTAHKPGLREGWLAPALGALVIAGWSVARPANGYRETARLLTGQMRREWYWERFGRPFHGDFSFLADLWAARYIRQHTRESDPVFIWGFEPLTLFLAGRYAPTRFVFAVPLVAPWTPPRWRTELLRDLTAHPPALFGVMRHDAIPHASGRSDDSAAQLEQFPELRAFLHAHYRYETTIEDLTLYRRKQEG